MIQLHGSFEQRSTSYYLCLPFGCRLVCEAQTDPNFVDLGIRFITPPPSEVKINEVFGVLAEVYLDANSSTVPAGETITANVHLVDPGGIIIHTHPQTWDGFTAPEPIETTRNQLLLQVPWSQANKWYDDVYLNDRNASAKWKIVLNLTASSVESDTSDNSVTHEFDLFLPDLSLSIDGVTCYRPIDWVADGQLCTKYKLYGYGNP